MDVLEIQLANKYHAMKILYDCRYGTFNKYIDYLTKRYIYFAENKLFKTLSEEKVNSFKILGQLLHKTMSEVKSVCLD